MSYRLIDSNEIAIKYPEVNEMDCIYVDLPNGLDNEYHYIESEPQRAYEQGVKDTLDKYDEDCRIASALRIAVGCKTAKECWELARNGDIQVVKHGRWIKRGDNSWECSVCHEISCCSGNYCPDCGAQMDEVGNEAE